MKWLAYNKPQQARGLHHRARTVVQPLVLSHTISYDQSAVPRLGTNVPRHDTHVSRQGTHVSQRGTLPRV